MTRLLLPPVALLSSALCACSVSISDDPVVPPCTVGPEAGATPATWSRVYGETDQGGSNTGLLGAFSPSGGLLLAGTVGTAGIDVGGQRLSMDAPHVFFAPADATGAISNPSSFPALGFGLAGFALESNGDVIVMAKRDFDGIEVSRVGADGTVVWTTTLDTGGVRAELAVAPDGRVLVASDIGHDMTVAGVTVSVFEIALIALDGADGKPLWAFAQKDICPPGVPQHPDLRIGVDAAGNATMGISELCTSDDVHLDGTTAARVVSLDPLGAERWRLAPSGPAFLSALAVNAGGDVFIGGSLDGKPAQAVTKLSSVGASQWSQPTSLVDALATAPNGDPIALLQLDATFTLERLDAASGDVVFAHDYCETGISKIRSLVASDDGASLVITGDADTAFDHQTDLGQGPLAAGSTSSSMFAASFQL